MSDPYALPPGAKIISAPTEPTYDLPPGATIVQPRADRGGMGPGEPELPEGRSWGNALQSGVTEFLPSVWNQITGLYDMVTSPVQTAKAMGSVAEGGLSKLGRVSAEEAATAAERLKLLQGMDPKKPVLVPGLGTVVPELTMPRLQQIATYNDPEKVAARAEIERNFDLVAEHYAKRYGSMEGFKEAVATDPAGLLLDLSTVLTLGGGLARGAGNVANAVSQGSKVANIAGTAADVLGAAGRATDPIAQTLKVAGKVPGVVGDVAAEALGVTTGAGSAPLKTAFDIGREATGGPWSMRTQESLQRLKTGMRGKPDMDALVNDAKDALGNIRSDASALYEQRKTGPNGWAQDTTTLNFQPIRDTFDKVYGSLFNRNTGMSKVTDPGQMEKINKIKDKIAEWEANPAAHNLEGLDDLKQAIWGLKGTAEQRQLNRVADTLYGKIKDIVNKQSDVLYQGRPNEYRISQREYDRTRTKLDEIEKSLSLGKKATADTAVRKLLSVMRDNVYTNYGKRVESVNALEDLGGANILPELAGMTLASKSPRGLMRAVAGADALAAIGAGAAISPQFAWLLAGLPLTSPRLMGESALAAGRGMGAYDKFVGSQIAKAPEWLRGHPTTLGVGQAAEMNDLVGRKRGGYLSTMRGR